MARSTPVRQQRLAAWLVVWTTTAALGIQCIPEHAAADTEGLLSLFGVASSQPADHSTAATVGKQAPAGNNDEVTWLVADADDTVSEVVENTDSRDVATLSGKKDVRQPQDVQVNDLGLFDVRARGADLRAVLEMLSVRDKRNIVAGPDVKGTVTLNLYNVTFEEALAAVLHSSGLAYTIEDKFVYVDTPEQLSGVGNSEPELATRVVMLKYLPAEEAAKLIQPILTQRGTLTVSSPPQTGMSSDNTDAGGNSGTMRDCLLIRDEPARIAEIEQALAKLDIAPQQVLVEATILRATLSENNELGIDFTTLAGVDFEQLNSSSNAVRDLNVGTLDGPQLNDKNITFSTDFTNNVTNGGISFGWVHDQRALFLRALEQITDVTVVANPKVLALNKQLGQIIIGRRDGYLTTTVTETAAVQTVDFLETGTRLLFRPFVSGDGYIRMEIHPADSNGGLTESNLPFEETTEATSNILIQDGKTIVIGGLFRERALASRSQVPLVGNLPLVGALFKSSSDETFREEVIILLTVHVVKNTPEENELAESIRTDIEQIRLGTHRAMMFTGRHRLAQHYYHSALRAAGQKKMGTALFLTRSCLDLDPRMSQAIWLEQELTGQRRWETAGYRVREYVLDMIEVSGGDRPGDPTGIPPIPDDLYHDSDQGVQP